MLANSKLGVQELFTKLLEEPLGKCTSCQQRKLVIIDALDETEYESREDFLDLIKERFPWLPKWLVFFITSRPEHTVQSRLERYNPCVRICAGNNEQGSFYEQHEQDIQRFLEKRVDFSRLPYSVKDIAKKCNGLFLYAFYIVKVLNDPAHSGKIDRLSDLFPGNIDDVFRKNFKRVYDKVGKDIFKKLFGCAIVAPSPLPVAIIECILEREKSSQDGQEVIDVVSQFVVLRASDRLITFLHNLIPAWLTNKEKAGKLFIDKRGLFTPDGQYIVVKRSGVFYFQHACLNKSCATDLLSLWALLEIDQNRDDEMTCTFGWCHLYKPFSKSALGEQSQRLFTFLKLGPRVYRNNSSVVPTNSTCCYCGRLRELSDSNQESSLSAVRQLIIELYPHIFQYQVWNIQTGRPILEDAFCRSVQLNPFTYICHVSCADIKLRGCSGTYGALSFANIAVMNAVYTLEWKRELEDRGYQQLEEFEQPLFHMLRRGTLNLFKLKVCKSLPTGFETLFDRDMDFYVGVSPEKKWVVQSTDWVQLIRTGVQEQKFPTIITQMKTHVIPMVERFTFTNDDGYFVYSTPGSVSLHALHLQTGTVLQCLRGVNLFYCTKERRVGYLFRSETEERALFLKCT